jgi:hypothetical protein
MRDLATIYRKLQLLAAVRRCVMSAVGCLPAVGPIDELLDECPELTRRRLRYPLRPNRGGTGRVGLRDHAPKGVQTTAQILPQTFGPRDFAERTPGDGE